LHLFCFATEFTSIFFSLFAEYYHTLKTLICVSPGNFEYIDKEPPVPTKDHAIVKVTRIGICGTDLHAFEGTQPYFSYPRVLGHELAGQIVDINDSSEFKIGDIVTVMPYFYCGKCIACRNGKTNCCVQLKVAGVHTDGGFCEYYLVPTYSLIHSRGLSFEELALTEPLAIGAHGVRRAEIKSGENVMIIGAGPIGLGLMEFAKLAGGNVIAMDINETRLAFCRENVGVKTINSEEQLRELTGGEMASVVVDATGNLNAINNGFRYVSHGGKYILVGLQKENIQFSHPEFHKREATLMSSRNATKEDFEKVLDAMTLKKFDPLKFITHSVGFNEVKDQFPSWLNAESNVIKAMVTMR
jgi:2-desacetyl-2-hydroxyethyl bacteriochlorophyllide A dehydrogenase